MQAPPAAAALLLRSLTRLTSDVIPTPDAFLNSSTFVSVRRLCSTAVLHAAAFSFYDCAQHLQTSGIVCDLC